MYIPQKRATGKKNNIFIICAACILFVLGCCLLLYFVGRGLRQRHPEPKYIPTQFLKRKWKNWCPGIASYGQVPNPRNAPSTDHDTSYHGAGGGDPEMTTTAANGVQRETSTRSIITLPAYSPSPKPTEQIIAREGERGGMDMVVEFPETADQQEARREDQMESLYQLRLQRRQELADRGSRRRERREARSRGDSTRLEQLAMESRARSSRRHEASNSNTSLNASTVVAEHQSRERGRRISSVSYAEIGHVRHDGSRLRADSHDSDHHPLLQNAAENSSSPSLMDPSSAHSRVESFTSSIRTASIATTEMDPLVLRPTSTWGSSRPVSQTDEGDLGTLNMPPPPEYEHLDWGDAPAYDSLTRDRNDEPRRLPQLSRLPSIHVNVSSPMTVSPVTPTGSHSRVLDDDPPTPPTPTGPIPPVVSGVAAGSTAAHNPVS